jgi:hypothetical protein
VEIKLRQRVPYQQKLEGDVLAIDFERPGAPASATPAAEPPAAEREPAAVGGEPAVPAEAEPKN